MSTTTPDTTPTPPADRPAPDDATGRGGGAAGITFDTIAILAFVVALGAALLSVFALALATRSIDEHRAVPASGGAAAPVSVELSEFSITPSEVSTPAGSMLQVDNGGSVVHDLTVEGEATPEIDPGSSAELDLSALEPGTYEMYCQIAGHRESGMEASITIE